MTRVLVDSDAFAYALGAVVQKTLYDVSATLPDGTTDEVVCPSADERDAWMASGFPEGTEFTVDPVVDAEPESHAIFLVKRVLSSIERAVDEAGIDYKNMELFLTGKGNFRDAIATIKEYKGNRDHASRPVHYKAIRRYLRRAWSAHTVEGYEADDKLAMVAHSLGYDPDKLVIVSMDKDLMTIPGRIYNYKRKKWYDITAGEALMHFYRQVLMGDGVDNVGGCWKCGEKKAAQLIQHTMTEQEMYATALSEYIMSVTRKGCPYIDLGGEAALLENARLLHLQRYEGEVWNPPKERTK